jgi:diaminopimelate decarboxylase
MGEGVLTGSGAFPRIDGVLSVGSVSLESVAEAYGTPVYVYSGDLVAEQLRRFLSAFAPLDLLLAYSVKANGNLAILHRVGALGAGADIVSAGELHRALEAGIPAERVVFAGVGKTREEMAFALRAGIHAFHVESEGELAALAEVAEQVGIPAPVGIRVNPDILTDTPHEYTRTGHAASKFGVPVDEALELYRAFASHPWLRLEGIDVHIGSQIIDVEPYERALDTVLEMVDTLAAEGILLSEVDLGGGFGVGYDGSEGLSPETVARVVVPRLQDRGLRLILEPGRSIVGEAGVLLTRVLYRKSSGGKTFVITDAGMTELLRPSHYGGWHRIEAVRERRGAPRTTVDVVGPICETGDFLARDRELPLPEPGELLAVGTAGAYGFTMASNYNARPRPPEVLVEGAEIHLVRARETLDDLIRGEVIPPLPGHAAATPAPSHSIGPRS